MDTLLAVTLPGSGWLWVAIRATVAAVWISAAYEEPSGGYFPMPPLRTILLAGCAAAGWAGYYLARVLGCLIVLALLASPASAQDVGAPGWGNLSARYGAYAFTQYQASADAPDMAPVPGTSLLGSITISRLYLGGKLDTRSNVVGEESFASIEGYALAAVQIKGPVAIAGTWGYVRPAFGSTGQDIEVMGGGVYVSPGLMWNGNAEAWVFLGALHRRASVPLDEPRWRPAVAFQIPLRDRASAVGDAMVGRAWVYRVGISYRVK